MSEQVKAASHDTGRAAGTDRAATRGGTGGYRLDLRLAVTIALGIAGGMLLLELTQVVLARLQGLLVAVVVSLFLSFAMEPAVHWLSQRNMRRGFGTALVFFVTGLVLAGFVAAMSPLVIDQVESLVSNAPQLLDNLGSQAERLPGGLGDSIAGYLQDASVPSNTQQITSRLGSGLLGFGTTVLSGLLQFFTILLVTFYLVADGNRVRRVLSSRLPEDRQQDALAVWDLAIEKTGGYVYGRALVAVASAAVHALAFTLIGVSNPIALGVWVGVISSLIPVVGTYIAGALPLVIALASDPIDAVLVLATVVVYQQVENYLIAPRITAHTMALHPAVAFLSVLAGAALLGAVGALLALPAAAIIGALVSAAGERHDTAEHSLL